MKYLRLSPKSIKTHILAEDGRMWCSGDYYLAPGFSKRFPNSKVCETPPTTGEELCPGCIRRKAEAIAKANSPASPDRYLERRLESRKYSRSS